MGSDQESGPESVTSSTTEESPLERDRETGGLAGPCLVRSGSRGVEGNPLDDVGPRVDLERSELAGPE